MKFVISNVLFVTDIGKHEDGFDCYFVYFMNKENVMITDPSYENLKQSRETLLQDMKDFNTLKSYECNICYKKVID